MTPLTRPCAGRAAEAAIGRTRLSAVSARACVEQRQQDSRARRGDGREEREQSLRQIGVRIPRAPRDTSGGSERVMRGSCRATAARARELGALCQRAADVAGGRDENPPDWRLAAWPPVRFSSGRRAAPPSYPAPCTLRTSQTPYLWPARQPDTPRQAGTPARRPTPLTQPADAFPSPSVHLARAGSTVFSVPVAHLCVPCPPPFLLVQPPRLASRLLRRPSPLRPASRHLR